MLPFPGLDACVSKLALASIAFRAERDVGELVPLRARQFVAADAAVAAFAGAPTVDAARFRADLAAALDHDATPRG
jgi:hypothetical protein